MQPLLRLLTSAAAGFCLISLQACWCKEPVEPKQNTILGRWQLSELQCYCIPSPLANEAVEFDANGTVIFYKDGQEESRSTYQIVTDTFVCGNTNTELIRFTSPQQPNLRDAAYTVDQRQLILDEGSCLDAPRKTYQRVLATN